MKTRSLVIHIGPGKTGTTSIQNWMHEGRRHLDRIGMHVLVTGENSGCHAEIANSLLGVRAEYVPGEVWARPWSQIRELIQVELVDTKQESLLLSYEGFYRLGIWEIEQLREATNASKVIVVAALRDPASHVYSWWTQATKNGNAWTFPQYCEQIALQAELPFVPSDYLGPWVSTCSQMRFLASGELRGSREDVVAQFSDIVGEALGIEASELPATKQLNAANVGRGGDFAELSRRFNRAFEDVLFDSEISASDYPNFTLARNVFVQSGAVEILRPHMEDLGHERGLSPGLATRFKQLSLSLWLRDRCQSKVGRADWEIVKDFDHSVRMLPTRSFSQDLLWHISNDGYEAAKLCAQSLIFGIAQMMDLGLGSRQHVEAVGLHPQAER